MSLRRYLKKSTNTETSLKKSAGDYFRSLLAKCNLNKAAPEAKSSSNFNISLRHWNYKPDHKNDMVHFEHPKSGTITIKRNDRTAEKSVYPFIAVHNGASIGRYSTPKDATVGVANYVRTLKPGDTRMFNMPSAAMHAAKEPKPLGKSDLSVKKNTKNKIKENDQYTMPLRREIKASLNSKNTELKGFLAQNPSFESVMSHPDFEKNQQFLRKRKLDTKTAQKLGVSHKWAIDHASIAINVADEIFKKNPERFKPTLTTGNAKTEHEGIATFDIPAIKTCPAADTCKEICYADAGQTRNFDKLAKYAVNFHSTRLPTFADEMDQLIKHLQSYKEGKDDPRDWSKLFRPHGYGDFKDKNYIKNWHEIMKRNPQTHFYAYTKSYAIPTLRELLFNAADILPNFTVRQSIGSTSNQSLDPHRPMAVIAENEDQVKSGEKNGMIYCHDKDSLAADKNNHIILLKAHGSSAKKHSLDKHLSGLPTFLHEKLKKELTGKDLINKAELDDSDRLDLSEHLSQPDEGFVQEKNLHHHFRRKMRRASNPNLK